LFVLSFLGGGFFFSIAQAKRHVQLQHLDSKNPFLFPFRVVNDDSFLTFYQVAPSSIWTTTNVATLAPGFDANTPGNFLTAKNTRLVMEAKEPKPVDIAPGDGHSFDFAIRIVGQTGIPDDLVLHLPIAYEIRFLSLLHLSFLTWHRQVGFGFHVQKDTNGTPYWIQD
jgi:hypothetical protein